MQMPRDQARDHSHRVSAGQQNERMPGAVEKERAIIHQTLQDSSGAGKIGEREETEPGCDYLPKAEQHHGGRKDRTHVPHPPAKSRPPWLQCHHRDGRAENRAKEDL